jgi:hypothetical protein
MKTCRKGLHQYEFIKGGPRGCQECKRANDVIYSQNNATKIKEISRLWYQKNKDKQNARCAIYRIENAEKCRELENRWRKNNRERNRDNRRAWAQKNPEKIRENRSNYVKKDPEAYKKKMAEYKRKNPHKVYVSVAKKRAALKRATPPWGIKFKDQIKELYAKAKELSLNGGERFVVDHIIPLQGRDVSGLHVPWNLQILTRSENSKKGRNYDCTDTLQCR